MSSWVPQACSCSLPTPPERGLPCSALWPLPEKGVGPPGDLGEVAAGVVEHDNDNDNEPSTEQQSLVAKIDSNAEAFI
jgi:hypothetical protein